MDVNGVRHILKKYSQIQLLNSVYKEITLKRKVTASNIAEEKFTLQPGFKLTWYYSGAGDDIKSEPRFIDNENTVNFIRYILMAVLKLD